MVSGERARGRRRRIPSAIHHLLLTFAIAVFIVPGSALNAHAQVRIAKIAAHPALWTVHSKTATVYLLGSIHLLPANVDWHTPEIDRAMDSASTFMFEAPLDAAGKAQVAEFVRTHGAMPAGTTLRSILPPKVRADYERALAAAHLVPEQLDGERPWLAAIVLDVAYLQHMHYVVSDGVDQQVYGYAVAHKKAVQTFETPAQQLSLFMPKDEKLEIAEFDANLKDFEAEESIIGAMIDAWGAGDAKSVGRLVNKSLDAEPGARKILIDDRNRNWIKILDDVLAKPGVTFVTVGTGHLVGPGGVPALLRKKGYKVEGP
ncbi:MAG TPA: TraB/GumN family protein [Rhizomicrobium sp.]|nr:TraB/GumN family protein [Rhizomicrobium sp.]